MPSDVLQRLAETLRSPAIARILERARDQAEESIPGREASASDPSLVYREHYANQAREAHEEIAAVDALREALGSYDLAAVWRPDEDFGSWRRANLPGHSLLVRPLLPSDPADPAGSHFWAMYGYQSGYASGEAAAMRAAEQAAGIWK